MYDQFNNPNTQINEGADDVTIINITAPEEGITEVLEKIKAEVLTLSSNDTEYCRVWMHDVFKIMNRYETPNKVEDTSTSEIKEENV